MAISLNHLLALDWKTWVLRNNPTDAIPVSIFSYSDSVTTTTQTLWDGLPNVFQFPTNSTTLAIVSTSVTSDSGAKIQISGLDSNWNIIEEIVTLDGASPVSTSNAFHRINSMAMTAPASGNVSNVGIITAKQNSTTLAQINPTIGRTQMGVYSVPSGYTLFVYSVDAYSGDAAANGKHTDFNVKITPNASLTPVTYDLLQTAFFDRFSVQRLVPQIQLQKTDIQWQFAVSQGTQSCSLIVQGMLLANP